VKVGRLVAPHAPGELVGVGRVRFQAAGQDSGGWSEARLPKPRSAPAGYTANTVITEWLTVNCRGDWASHAIARELRVRFAELSDRDRAVARFGETSAEEA
jgi:hypothetical protein